MSRHPKEIIWCDRHLVLSPYHFALCIDKSSYRRELKRMNVTSADTQPFLGGNAHAVTRFFESNDGGVSCIVCLGSTKGRTREQIMSLLVHEAVHIWRAIRDYLNEDRPSEEFEAYSMQHISQELFVAYRALTRRKS